ncbi:MAG: glycosyltransferase [Chloroflexi bacterium]|nr:glycosyltransferase [Chloroflexota bacterium]
MRLRIAVVAPLFAPLRPAMPYGPHAFLLDLAGSLASRGHEVRVYCAAGSTAPGLQLVEVPVSPLVTTTLVRPVAERQADRSSSLARPRPTAPRAAAAVRDTFRRAFDAIDQQGADAISGHAFDAAAIECTTGRPVLHTLHLPPIVPEVVAAARRTHGVLATVSEAARRDWAAAGIADVLVLRNGIPDQAPEPATVEPVALIAGRISPEKGVAAGIRVALRAGLRPRVVGEAYDRTYFETEVRPLLDQVELLPTVPRHALWRLMARAAVTLLPIAWEEPFGLVAAEAQMAGSPVVGYRRGALPEVVEEGVSGFLVDPDDEDALVVAVSRAQRLDRARVRASARRRLGLDAAVDAYEAVLLEVAGGRRR